MHKSRGIAWKSVSSASTIRYKYRRRFAIPSCAPWLTEVVRSWWTKEPLSKNMSLVLPFAVQVTTVGLIYVSVHRFTVTFHIFRNITTFTLNSRKGACSRNSFSLSMILAQKRICNRISEVLNLG